MPTYAHKDHWEAEDEKGGLEPEGGRWVSTKTLYKKTVQANVDDDILNKQCFSRAHTVERRE